jgi:hypothetical protein
MLTGGAAAERRAGMEWRAEEGLTEGKPALGLVAK